MLLVLSYRNLPTFVKSEQSQRCLEESYVSIFGMVVCLINLLISGMMLISLKQELFFLFHDYALQTLAGEFSEITAFLES